jgi:D-threo-aldose 1-dehydrogenase
MNQWQAPLRMVEATDLDVVMLAGRWTLLDRTGQRMLDECASSGVAVVAAAPFNSGLLAVDEPADGAYFDYGPASPDILARARRLAEVCRRHGITLPAAALRFPLRHPAVASVVCGMRTAEQVASTLERFAAAIPESAWTELDGELHD